MRDIKYDKFRQYLVKEIDMLIFNLSVSLSEEYNYFIDSEQKEYKKTPQYKKIMREHENSQGKYYGLGKTLNKLSTWESTTGRSTNDPHISYHNKSNEWSESSPEPLGYKPSISRSDYIIARLKELRTKYNNAISNIIYESVYQKWTHATAETVYDANFEVFCLQFCADPYFHIDNYIKDILAIIKEHKPAYTTNRSFHIVTNNCNVDALILQSNKITTFTINIDKFPNQKTILGKAIGDEFTLPNIDLTYRIDKIYNSSYSRHLSDFLDPL